MKLFIILLISLVLIQSQTIAMKWGRNNLKDSDVDHLNDGHKLYSISVKNNRFKNSERTWAKKFRFHRNHRTIAEINGRNNLKDVDHIWGGNQQNNNRKLYSIATKNARFTNSDRTWAKKFRFTERRGLEHVSTQVPFRKKNKELFSISDMKAKFDNGKTWTRRFRFSAPQANTNAAKYGRNNLKENQIDHFYQESQGKHDVALYSIADKNARFTNSDRTWAFRFNKREFASNEAHHMGNSLPTGTFDGTIHYGDRTLHSLESLNTRFADKNRWHRFRFNKREFAKNEAHHMGNNLPTGTFDGTLKYKNRTLHSLESMNVKFADMSKWARKFRFNRRQKIVREVKRVNEAHEMHNNLLTGTFDGTLEYGHRILHSLESMNVKFNDKSKWSY